MSDYDVWRRLAEVMMERDRLKAELEAARPAIERYNANEADNAYRYKMQANNDSLMVIEARKSAVADSRHCGECAHFDEPSPQRYGYGVCYNRPQKIYGLPMPNFPAGTCPGFKPKGDA